MGTFAEGVSGLIVVCKENGNQTPLTLLTMLMDDSSSMSFCNNAEVAMLGHNSLLDYLEKSPQAQQFFTKTQFVHGRSLAGEYRPLASAPRMTRNNYFLLGGTPFFWSSDDVLLQVQKLAQGFAEEGYDVYTLTLLFTDGFNRDRNHNTTARDVSLVLKPMIESGKHIVAGVGVAYRDVDFRAVFLEMGIPPQWILTLRSAEEIKAMFGTFAMRAEEASKSSVRFADTQFIGFGDTSLGPKD